jgi:hypothetical protein
MLYGSEYPFLVYSHLTAFSLHREQGFWESHFSLEMAHSLQAVLLREALLGDEPERSSAFRAFSHFRICRSSTSLQRDHD